MNNRIITDITEFIFVEDKPQKADIIFLPGGSFPEQGEYAVKLYKDGYADKLLPSGGVSVKSGKVNSVKSKQDIYNKDYQTDCEFLTDVQLKTAFQRRQFTKRESRDIQEIMPLCHTSSPMRIYFQSINQ